MQGRTYSLKAQVGIIGGVLPGFVTRIDNDSVRRWNLWFPLAAVFAKVRREGEGDADYLPPFIAILVHKHIVKLS